MIFNTEGIIMNDESEDVWSIYKLDMKKDAYKSLYNAMFEESFNPKIDKLYSIKHSVFYRMITQKRGAKHIARLIQKICEFLGELSDLKLVHGNLRPENILIKMDEE